MNYFEDLNVSHIQEETGEKKNFAKSSLFLKEKFLLVFISSVIVPAVYVHIYPLGSIRKVFMIYLTIPAWIQDSTNNFIDPFQRVG